jgi:GntR family transcriptional regulator
MSPDSGARGCRHAVEDRVDRPESFLPRHRHIEIDLKQRLARGDIKPGAKIPTERELEDEYRVSRITVRRALDTLRYEGHVRAVPGKGFFAATEIPGSVWRVGSIEELIREAAATSYKLLEVKAERPTAYIRQTLQLPADATVVRFRGIRSNDATPVMVLDVYLPRRLGDPLRATELTVEPILVQVERRSGMEATTGRQTITVTAVPVGIGRLMNLRAGAPVLHIERVYYAASGEPIEQALSWIRPDRYQHVSTLLRR